MITFDNSIKICQDETKDYTDANLTIIKAGLNQGYKYIQAEVARSVTQKTRTAFTVANQQYYQCPKDFLFPISITVKVGTITYPVDVEESQENWDRLNAYPQTITIPRKAFIRRSFGINNLEIGLWPTPASAGNTISIVYEASDKDCTTLSYTTGTVAVTNGSATLTGTGTVWTSAMIGRWVNLTPPTGDGLWYRVQAANSPTSITLDQYYEGSTGSGLAYQISEAFNLPEEMQILPCYYVLQHYYAIKGSDAKELKNKNLFDEGIAKGKIRYANKGKSPVIKTNYWNGQPYSIPAHFPSTFS